MMAKAGRLDTKIIIQRGAVIRNEAGEKIKTWVEFATVWAEEIKPSGREIFSSDTRIAEVARIFKIRYIPNVLETFRVVEGERNYDIKAINPIGRNNMIELVVMSIGADSEVSLNDDGTGFGNVPFG